MKKRQKVMYINGTIYRSTKTKTRLMIDIQQTDGYTCIITPTVCLVNCNRWETSGKSGIKTEVVVQAGKGIAFLVKTWIDRSQNEKTGCDSGMRTNNRRGGQWHFFRMRLQWNKFYYLTPYFFHYFIFIIFFFVWLSPTPSRNSSSTPMELPKAARVQSQMAGHK